MDAAGAFDRGCDHGHAAVAESTDPMGSSLSVAKLSVERAPLSAVDADIATQWDAIASEQSDPNVFTHRWFQRPGFSHLAPDDVQLLIVRDGDQLIALMPIIRARHYGRLPLRNTENWVHPHCFLGVPVLRSMHEVAAWTAIIRALDNDPNAGALLHVTGLVEGSVAHQSLAHASRQLSRPCDVVHRIERAMLASDLPPDAYYAATVRKKKRKELARLQNRLEDLGGITRRRFTEGDDLSQWIDDFLSLESSGWKGDAGSALACTPQTQAFFREMIGYAHAASKLDMLRIDHKGVAIAMLINLIDAPGGFSYKTAYDEGYARYSPGVLIQLDNLQLLARNDIGWIDSCAVENHPMINSLWAERRAIIRVSVPLNGPLRAVKFAAARTLERASAAWRARKNARPVQEAEA